MSDMRFKSKLAGLMSMKGYWIKSIVVFLILALLSFGISQLEFAFRNILKVPMVNPNGYPNYSANSIIIDVVATIVQIIVLSPLIVGVFEWFYDIISGKSPKIGDIFAWFGSGKLFMRSMCLSLNVFIRTLFWGVLIFAIPTFLNIYGMVNIEKIGTDFSNLTAAQTKTLLIASIAIFFSLALFIACALLFLLVVTKYIPAFYLFVEDKNIKARDAVKTSIRYTKGKRWEFTVFIFSFIGWFISCFLIFPIIYVFPYFFSSLTVYSKSHIYSQRNKENKAKDINSDATKKFDVVNDGTDNTEHSENNESTDTEENTDTSTQTSNDQQNKPNESDENDKDNTLTK